MSNEVLQDDAWLQAWSQHMQFTPTSVLVPSEARQITTLSTWRQLLVSHPHRALLPHGNNPRIQTGIALSPAKKNMKSALDHPEVVSTYLQSEISNSRVIGPFPKHAIPGAHISRFGVIPKSHQFDLSHPKSKSINDGIPKDLCSMSYITVDDAINRITQIGPGALALSKSRYQKRFPLAPNTPSRQTAMECLFIDACLPRSAPKVFNILADFLAWILENQGVSFVLHYLDDFLTVGQPESPECQHNLQTIIQICQFLNVPLALEKVGGPATSLEFLSILLDTVRISPEKLQRIYQEIMTWLDKRSATKRQILSLVGLLQHAAKVVCRGRTFMGRMYSVAAKVEDLDFYTRLNKDFRSDLYWWYTFITKWNGTSIISPVSTPQATIQTDASWLFGLQGRRKHFDSGQAIIKVGGPGDGKF